jgi:hypothetical protein
VSDQTRSLSCFSPLRAASVIESDKAGSGVASQGPIFVVGVEPPQDAAGRREGPI